MAGPSLMRTVVKVIGWLLIVGYTLSAGVSVIREITPETATGGTSGGSVGERLSENFQSRPLSEQLTMDFLLIALGVVLVIASRPKHSLAEASKSGSIPRFQREIPNWRSASRRTTILAVVIVGILVGGLLLVLRAPATENADDSAGLRLLAVRTSVNEAEFPVARGILAVQGCSTDSDCDEALRDFRTILVTYEPILEAAVAELGALRAASAPNPALLDLVKSFRDLYSIRLEGVRLYMKAIGPQIDVAMLDAGDQKWIEAALKNSDVLDALQRYAATEE